MDPTARLTSLLEAAARGSFPPPDGRVEVLPGPAGRAQGVLAFSAHFVVAADVDEPWVREHMPEGDFLAPTAPAVLDALAHRLGREPDAVDLVLAAPGLGGGSDALHETDATHPRLERARAHREDVRAYEDVDGATVVAIGHGLALRQEVSFEVDPAARGAGRARRALAEAQKLVPAGSWLFAQSSPGNVASIRALLGAGFVPIGGEVLFYVDRAP